MGLNRFDGDEDELQLAYRVNAIRDIKEHKPQMPTETLRQWEPPQGGNSIADAGSRKALCSVLKKENR